MNELIKQLKTQALQEIADKSDNLVEGETITLREFHDLVETRFVELIANECAELCDRFQARDVGMQPAECAGAIRAMFGIK